MCIIMQNILQPKTNHPSITKCYCPCYSYGISFLICNQMKENLAIVLFPRGQTIIAEPETKLITQELPSVQHLQPQGAT